MQNVNKRCEYRKGKEKQTSYASNLEEIHYKSVPWAGKKPSTSQSCHILQTQEMMCFFYPDKEIFELS